MSEVQSRREAYGEILEKIGFIGLGIMGKPMAKNLIKAGYKLVVYNRSTPAIKEMVSAGAEKASSSKEVAEKSQIIITMLPDSPQVEEVILGPNGVIEGIKSGSIVIDMSSISPLVSKKIAEELKKKNVQMLDAPVSGGEPGAIAGTLAIMVGGEELILEKVKPILEKMGKSVILVGALGAGNFTKLANQIIVGINIEAISEALVLGAKAGINPELLYKAIRGGLAGSNVLDAKVPMILDRNFKPGFRIKLHQKDLNNALLTAKELNVSLPVTALVQQILSALISDGKADFDHSAICNFIEKISNVEVKRTI